MRRTIGMVLTLALAAGAALAGCSDDGEPTAQPPVALPDDLVLVGSLEGFDACDDFLAHMQQEALRIVTPWGLGGGGYGMVDDAAGEAPAMEDSEAADGAAPVPGEQRADAPVEGEDYSGTNVQEVGVDEPDHVKTDGRTMYVVANGQLHVLDVSGEDPVELTTVDLRDAWDAQLLLDDDRLLVTSSAYGAIPFTGESIRADTMPVPGWSGATSITLLDVSDPSDPVALERLTVDGATLSSRLVDGVARIVVRTEQGNLPWVYPEGSGIRAERAALEANRDLIRDSEAEDWIPWYVHETADGRETDGPLLACNRIAHPEEFAGLGILSVLTVDLSTGGLRPGSETLGVLAGGDTIYASREALYVATTRWFDWANMAERDRERRMSEITTEIHAFDIADPRDVSYLGSGEVPGTLLSQWAMSEYDGHLRVASTVGDTWGWSSEPSESVVTVLAVRGDELAQVGQVTGLGLTERIYAVRFIGDVGYVVTFRETDPLYTLDLADPTDPQVVGELKIMGYSAYLHPVGDDLLLGVGQDADAQGRLKGTQLSLFDVSDPSDPRRIDQATLGEGMSDVEYDHRAFLHWPATGLTVVPFMRWDVEPTRTMDQPMAGAVGFTADRADGLQRIGMLSHTALLKAAFEDEYGQDWSQGGDDAPDGQDWSDVEPDADDGDAVTQPEVDTVAPELWWEWGWQAQIRRSVVMGDRLLTISDFGVATHDLDTLDDLGLVTFDR
jgi:hypothetical protein